MTKEEFEALPIEKQNEIIKFRDEIDRCLHITRHYDDIFDSINKKYDKLTSLTKKDWSFFALALSLQVARQYLLTKFPKRLTDKEAAKFTQGHDEEHSNRAHKWYHPSLAEIISNPVPFDTTIGSPTYNLNLGGKHRHKTLGHDPILGYIWGTMNIVTSTLTTNNFQSFHVKTGELKKDYLSNNAQNEKIIEYSVNRIFKEGNEGRIALATALLKEHIHLKSDVGSKDSLPIPLVSLANTNLSVNMAKYGFDVLNIKGIAKQAVLSTFVNWIIGSLHYLCKPQNVDAELYEVKTRKILLLSNCAASSSNLVATAITNNYKLLDVGGYFVTLYRIFSDMKFMEKIRSEFTEKEFQKILNDNKNEYGF